MRGASSNAPITPTATTTAATPSPPQPITGIPPGTEHARQTELADDRAARTVRAEEGRQHVAGRDRDRADEDARGRAQDERDREQREDGGRAHYGKSSGCTSFA